MKRYLIAAGILAGLALIPAAVMQPAEEFQPYSWNESRLDNNDGTLTSSFSTKWINFYDGSEWEEINVQPEQSLFGFGDWKVEEAPYGLEIPRFADGKVVFVSNNKWDRETASEINDPEISKTKSFSGALHVLGVKEGSAITYTNALKGVGDIVYEPHEQEFRAMVRINELPVACALGAKELRIPFTESYSDGLQPNGRGGEIPSRNTEIGNGVTIFSGKRAISTKQAYVWDANRREEIKIEGKFARGSLQASKVIPCGFFSKAEYPVFTDTVSTFYPNANTETTSVDGFISADGNVQGSPGRDAADWNAVHDFTSGWSASDSATTMLAGVVDDGDLHIRRAILLFDTSALTANAIITAADVDIYATAKVNTDNDGDDYITIVPSSPASNTALVVGDYDAVGAVNNPTKYSDDIDIGSITTSAYNTWTLNATGLSNISKTSITKFGVREGHDQIDSQIASATSSYITMSTADHTGTSQDSRLSVTFTLLAPTKGIIIIDFLRSLLPFQYV